MPERNVSSDVTTIVIPSEVEGQPRSTFVVVDDQLPQSGLRLSLDELGMTTVGRA